MADEILETILLLALPASGKSEVRKYLDHLSPEKRTEDFHMGPNAQLDDFPYVHIMRRVDEELDKRKGRRVFFKSGDQPFMDPRDWGTLTYLLNEDHAAILEGKDVHPESAADHILKRIDSAAGLAGIPPRLAEIPCGPRKDILETLEKECRDLVEERQGSKAGGLDGKTLVIEFARGGPQGSKLPLPAPFGYRYSLSCLSEAILKKAVILYVWVTPEESRRKNEARTDPNDPGSILHHGVPIDVMLNDYGTDDMDWLVRNSGKPDAVKVEAYGKTFYLPAARFDNRVDKTTFLRGDAKDWKPEHVKAVHEGLKGALDKLAAAPARA